MENHGDIQEFFLAQKKRIAAALLEFLDKKKKGLRAVGPWGPDAIRRLKRFTVNGKMVRGGLVMLGYQMYEPDFAKDKETALFVAAAMELFHSGLLVHDDIMDHDPVRRGAPTIFAQYARSAPAGLSAKSKSAFGEGMGICAGDLTFFLGFELIFLACKNRPALLQSLLDLFSRELQMVTAAQMEDLSLGASSAAGKSAILKTYRYKTARYTFILPLTAGMRIAGKNTGPGKIMESLCDDLGILYQLKDDEIGLFGTAAEIGKPPGSDVRENKKTLLRHYLFECAPEHARKKLEKIFGNPRMTPAQREYVRNLAKSRSLPLLKKETERIARRAAAKIEKLEIAESYRRMFREFLDYGLTRSA